MDTIVGDRIIQQHILAIATQMICVFITASNVIYGCTCCIVLTSILSIFDSGKLAILMLLTVFFEYLGVSIHCNQIVSMYRVYCYQPLKVVIVSLYKKIGDTSLPGLNSSERSSQQSARFPNPWSFGQLFFPHTRPGIQSESSVQSPSPAPHLCSDVQHPSR